MAAPPADANARGLQAAQVLGVLCNLIVDACRSPTRATLAFKLLNSTVHLVHYDRAVLWDLDGAQPRCLGISGQAEVSRAAPRVRDLQRLAAHIPPAEKPMTPTRGGLTFHSTARALSILTARLRSFSCAGYR